MANTCLQHIEFRTEKENFPSLIKYLTNNIEGIENKILNKEVLIDEYQKGIIRDIESRLTYADTDYDNNIIRLSFTHNWFPVYNYFIDNKNLIELEVSISGYSEESGCGLYETYEIDENGNFDKVDYDNTVEGKISFFNDTNQDDFEYILDSFSYIVDNGLGIKVHQDILDVLDYKKFNEETSNLYNKKFNNYSLILLAFLQDDLRKYNYKELNTIFELANADVVYLLLIDDQFGLLSKMNKYILNKSLPDSIIKATPKLLQGREIYAPDLNYIISTCDDKIKSARFIYNKINEDTKTYYFKLIEEEYCDKVMLMEKKLMGI